MEQVGLFWNTGSAPDFEIYFKTSFLNIPVFSKSHHVSCRKYFKNILKSQIHKIN